MKINQSIRSQILSQLSFTSVQHFSHDRKVPSHNGAKKTSVDKLTFCQYWSTDLNVFLLNENAKIRSTHDTNDIFCPPFTGSKPCQCRFACRKLIFRTLKILSHQCGKINFPHAKQHRQGLLSVNVGQKRFNRIRENNFFEEHFLIQTKDLFKLNNSYLISRKSLKKIIFFGSIRSFF